MAGSIVACAIALSVVWTPQISALLTRPLTNLFDGGSEPPEQKALYSIAISRRKQGKFIEAVMEIRSQLARFPNDFEGVLLLAGIQAEDLKDLASAEITLNHFCDQPHPPPRQVAAAMNHLADWHLKLSQDADSARVALGNIVARFPGTESALLAAQRIARLEGTEKLLLAARDRQPVPVPEGPKSFGLHPAPEQLRPAKTEPEQLAADYVKHLEQHPLDTEARGQLAILYADHYQRLDLATAELDQLIEMPAQPPKHVAHWLNLLADLQVRHGADYATVRQTLETIVERFPDWAAAEIARVRINRLKLELKGHAGSENVKLGIYEQNIGLKYGPPRQS
jgi:TolA-binding protein